MMRRVGFLVALLVAALVGRAAGVREGIELGKITGRARGWLDASDPMRAALVRPTPPAPVLRRANLFAGPRWWVALVAFTLAELVVLVVVYGATFLLGLT